MANGIWNLPRLSYSSSRYSRIGDENVVQKYYTAETMICCTSKLDVMITWLYVDRLNAVLSPDASSVTCRNHLDSLAPQQHTAAVAAAEHDMPGTRLKVVPS